MKLMFKTGNPPCPGTYFSRRAGERDCYMRWFSGEYWHFGYGNFTEDNIGIKSPEEIRHAITQVSRREFGRLSFDHNEGMQWLPAEDFVVPGLFDF